MSKNRVIVEAVLAGRSYAAVAEQYGISKVRVGKLILIARLRTGGLEVLGSNPVTQSRTTTQPHEQFNNQDRPSSILRP